VDVLTNEIFSEIDPFKGVDLATIDDATVEALQTMREAAEDAETSLFNPAIEAASGAQADALQVGKIKNKVLKLTGEVQVLQIQVSACQLLDINFILTPCCSLLRLRPLEMIPLTSKRSCLKNSTLISLHGRIYADLSSEQNFPRTLTLMSRVRVSPPRVSHKGLGGIGFFVYLVTSILFSSQEMTRVSSGKFCDSNYCDGLTRLEVFGL